MAVRKALNGTDTIRVVVLTRSLTLYIESEGLKLSVNDFIVRAIALALRDVPEANVAWNGEAIRR